MDKVILAGPFVGEFGWEVLRFAPHVLWLKCKKHKSKVGLIVYTRPDRFDLYGNYADKLIPLDINNRSTDCFKSLDISYEQYEKLASDVHTKLKTQYQIVNHIYPTIIKKTYANKNQFSKQQTYYKYNPRQPNKQLVDSIIPDDKPLVAIGPRLRKMAKKRNWPHWQEFYDQIEHIKDFNFVICGRAPEYVSDPKDRFFDVNKFPIDSTPNTSMVGVIIEVLKKSVLCVGSQSGIPNLSNLVGTPTLQWGNEKKAHSTLYNVKNTPTTFIIDKQFEIKPKQIVTQMKQLLREK
jgi:ADP-heptose:LPS heptosyltransferase